MIEWHRFFAQLAFEQSAFEVMITLLETLSQDESFADIQQIIQSKLLSLH
jgi:hypothetical protein